MGAGDSVLANYEVGKPYETVDHLSEGSKTSKSRNPESKRQRRRGTGSREATSSTGPKRQVAYQIRPAVNKEDGSSISVLIFEKERQSKSSNGANCAEVLRMVRHPFILKYIGVTESDRSIKLLTEDILSLEYCIHELEDFEIISGLHNILEALIFLHEKGCLAHNNLCWSSVFVSRKDGNWKLGGMEKVEKVSPKNIELDVISLAEFAISLMDLIENGGQEEKNFVERLEKIKQKQFDGLDVASLGTTHLKALLYDPLFRNSYLEISKFLNDITMKKEAEKEEFFRGLADKLRSLNHETVARKFLSRLFSRLILSEPSAEKFFIPQLLAFGEGSHDGDFEPIFPDDVYRKNCAPLILNLLFCDETHVRLLLLKFISLFVKAFDMETLQNQILPEILIGVRDANDAIVCATLHGLACLVPILGGDVVIGGERTKVFKDQRPKFSPRSQQGSNVLPEQLSGSDSPSPSHGSRRETKEALQQKKEERKRRQELRKQMREQEKERQKKSANLLTRNLADTDTRSESTKQEPNSLEEMQQMSIPPSNEDSVSKIPNVTSRNEDSEPDWEGFEAFSSESDAEEEDTGSRLIKSSKSAESLLLVSKDSLSMAQNGVSSSKTKTEASQNVQTDPLLERNTTIVEESKASPLISNLLRLDSASSSNSIASIDDTLSNKTECYQKEDGVNASKTKTKKASSFNLKASFKKEAADSNDSNEKNNHQIDQSSFKKPEQILQTGLSSSKEKPLNSKLKSVAKKQLGEEFEFQVSVHRAEAEPDFFADMTPDLTKSTTVLIERNLPTVSSKFEAIEPSCEVTSGWEEDGWDDFA